MKQIKLLIKKYKNGQEKEKLSEYVHYRKSDIDRARQE